VKAGGPQPARSAVGGGLRRVFVLGLDGATFDLIGPWIDSGELANLKRLQDAGVRGELESVYPPLTPCAWPSFFMGKNPGKHGLFGYKVRRKGSYEEVPLASSDRRGRTLFELVGDQGGMVAVLSVPMTYPATEVAGVMTTCIFTPKLADPYEADCAFPPAFKDEMKRVIGTFRIHPEHVYAKGRIEDLLRDYKETLEQRIKLCEHVLKTHPWDFAIAVLNETDHIQHQLWHLIDPSHQDHDPGEAREFGPAIKDFWIHVDREIGRILALLPADTTVIVMSDHGHGAIHWWIHLNNLLAREGLLAFKRNPLAWLKRALFRLGFTPATAFRLRRAFDRRGRKKKGAAEGGGGASPLFRKIFLSENDVDWSRTRCWATGHMGQINVNLKGREPAGIVSKSEVPALRGQIEAALAKLVEPGSGAPIVERLVPREDLYHGEMVSLASDFFVRTRKPEFQALGGASFISNRVLERSWGNSATHRMNGIFLMRGPKVRRGARASGLRIFDLAGHILYRLGLRVPEDFDSAISPDLYEPGTLDADPPKSMPVSEIKASGAAKQLSPDEIARMKENLKKLGYVD
jgi:predicted AlkP superfamily phosphohydrolase/phosphomutase